MWLYCEFFNLPLSCFFNNPTSRLCAHCPGAQVHPCDRLAPAVSSPSCPLLTVTRWHSSTPVKAPCASYLHARPRPTIKALADGCSLPHSSHPCELWPLLMWPPACCECLPLPGPTTIIDPRITCNSPGIISRDMLEWSLENPIGRLTPPFIAQWLLHNIWLHDCL